MREIDRVWIHEGRCAAPGERCSVRGQVGYGVDRRSSTVDHSHGLVRVVRGMSACRCVGVTLMCDTSVGGRPGQAKQESRIKNRESRIENRESRIEMLPPPPPPSPRFRPVLAGYRLQAAGMKKDSLGAKDFRLALGSGSGSNVTTPVSYPLSNSGQRSTTANNGQRRPVSKPERLLEPLAREPSRVVLCCVFLPRHETRNTKYEIRDKRHETRAQESRNQGIKESRT